MVAAVVVVSAAAVISILAFIPHIGQSCHRAGLFPVEPLQETGVNRFAVGAHPIVVEIQGAGQEALVAGHQVRQVPQGSSIMAIGSDMNVHSAAVGRVADCSGVAELAGDFL